MELTLQPRRIGGTIAAIASKSQAHRLLICAALSDRRTEIVCRETSKDIEATVRCLSALGAQIAYENETFIVEPILSARENAVLDCGESGSTLRFLLPVVAALGLGAEFILRGRLPERPLSPLWELLESKGIALSKPSENILRVRGKLACGSYPIAGNISSQFISGLLFALPLTGGESDIMLTSDLQSAHYIDLTLDALRSFAISVERNDAHFRIPPGQIYRACEKVSVEGDWSNAAFWLCAGAICAPIEVTGLKANSAQGDRRILELLKRFGAKVEYSDNAVRVSPQPLVGIDIDARNIPDLVPPLALLASCAKGITHIYGAERLRLKESDRLWSVYRALNAIGGKVRLAPDGLTIEGSPLIGGRIDNQNDHRIAMMAGIASALCREPIELIGSEAVEKSYPKFWKDFEGLVI